MTNVTFDVSKFNRQMRSLGLRFVYEYAPLFCIYSSTTDTVYLDYNLEAHKDNVLAIPDGHLSIVSNVKNEYIVPTRFLLVPNMELTKVVIYDRFNNSSHLLNQFIFKFIVEGGNIPLIGSSNFREIGKQKYPSLMISKLDLNSGLSELQNKLIRDVASERLATFISENELRNRA